MKIVVLDGYSINPGDLSWSPLSALGTFHSFDRTAEEEILNHIDDSEVFFVSKCHITRSILEKCPNLKALVRICVSRICKDRIWLHRF